jgi:PAS domain S-box-containing protein
MSVTGCRGNRLTFTRSYLQDSSSTGWYKGKIDSDYSKCYRKTATGSTTFYVRFFLTDFSGIEGGKLTDERNSKEPLTSGLAMLRQRITDLEILAAQHKQTEEELRKSEQKYRILVEDSHVGIIGSDSEGRIDFANKAICEMLGYSEEETLGKLFADFIHPDDLAKIIAVFQQALNSPSPIGPIHLEFRVINEKGNILYLEAMPAATRCQGKVIGFHSVISDITRRKETEHKLSAYQEDLQSLASQLSLAEERERRRIATEVHDRVSQSLAFCWMKLEKILVSAPPPNFVEQLSALRISLKELIEDVRSLTFELSSPLLYSIGLVAALEHLTEQFQAQYDIRCCFEDNGESKPLEDNVSVLLFQAVRELLTNVVKHAKADTASVVMKSQGTAVCITVEDDGVGFNTVAPDQNGFGLFSVRERLRFLGGSFRIESETNEGTRAILTIPFKQK